MSDIVERLRECAMNHARGSWSWPEEKADPVTGMLLDQAADEIERLRALVPEQEGASEALPDRASARDTPIIPEPDFAGRVRDFNEAVSSPTSPNAREAALERARKRLGSWTIDGIRERVAQNDHVSASLDEAINAACDLAELALLSPHGGTQDIASIVETYTDILSPETARKVASRIRSISTSSGK